MNVSTIDFCNKTLQIDCQVFPCIVYRCCQLHSLQCTSSNAVHSACRTKFVHVHGFNLMDFAVRKITVTNPRVSVLWVHADRLVCMSLCLVCPGFVSNPKTASTPHNCMRNLLKRNSGCQSMKCVIPSLGKFLWFLQGFLQYLAQPCQTQENCLFIGMGPSNLLGCPMLFKMTLIA